MSDDIFSAKAALCSPVRNAGGVNQNKRRRGSYASFFTLTLMLAVFAAIPARAEPRTIEDCEKIQAADAYNQCLASFGPVAHERGVKADPEGGGGHASGNAAAEEAAPRRHGGRTSHGRGYQHQSSRHQAGHSSRHADPWEHMRHAGSGRKRAEFRVRHH